MKTIHEDHLVHLDVVLMLSVHLSAKFIYEQAEKYSDLNCGQILISRSRSN